VLAHIDRHPHIAMQNRLIEEAQTELQLAKADRQPDWSVQAVYGHRPAFADYASVQLEIGLPFFTRSRQDQSIAAKAASLAQAESLKQDTLRQHVAEIELNRDDWRRLQSRFVRYDQTILPQAQLRLEAALTAYGAGTATLTQVLDARRALLDIRMQRLSLQMDAARHQTNLAYFAHGTENLP
jgi:outer membrane protein TolC